MKGKKPRTEGAMRARPEGTPSGGPRKRRFVVRDLEQARLLSSPLRLRLLGAFCGEPRTTKQVAGVLGEPPTKLYRHVDALHRAGLLELMGERRVRGAIERYFQAVAARFSVDGALLSTASATSRNAFERHFREASDDLAEYADGPEVDENLMGVVARIRVRAPRARAVELRRKLLDWVADCGRDSPAERGGDAITLSGLVVLHPLAKRASRRRP